ncbi:hypothetical protein MBLNU459_g6363t2 [Dothideomycetes sp. NU459]
MASLAEYCALWPSAGGQQFYTQIVAPPSCRRFLSYVVGWTILVGEVTTTAACALNSAQITAAFLEVTHPDIIWKVSHDATNYNLSSVLTFEQPYMTYLVYVAFLILPFFFNLVPKLLPRIQYFGAVFNIGCAVIWAAVFLAMAPKTDAEFIFTKFINSTGWNSNAWVFVLSMYIPIWGLCGTDSVMHLAEEMKNPSRDGPRVMVWAMIWTGVTAWVSAIIMCYTVGPDWADALNASSAYLTWFMNVTGSVYGGGVFCAIAMMGLNFLIVMNLYASGSRVVFSMARDKAFPYSDYLAHISTRFTIPLRGMFAFAIATALVGLLVLGSDLAFYAIISGGGIALQLSYCVPILCVICRGRGILPNYRPNWDLGRFGYAINITSILWSIVTLLFYIFPQYLPVEGDIQNMNWAIAMLGLVIAFAGIYWFCKGRKDYVLNSHPVVEVVDGMAVPTREDSIETKDLKSFTTTTIV